MKVKIEISTDNAAFHDEQGNPDAYYRNLEVAAILRHLADKLEIYAQAGVKKDEGIALMDINGNSVGKCEFVNEED